MGNHMKVEKQMNGMYEKICNTRSTEVGMKSDKKIQGMMVGMEAAHVENGVNLLSNTNAFNLNLRELHELKS